MKIAIVEDSATALESLRLVFDGSPEHTIAWVARNGAEAVRMCGQQQPDLILMDLLMPVMDGVEATRRIMAATPCAILVVTATVSGRPGMVFEAMGAGALDAVPRPVVGRDGRIKGAEALLNKIGRIGKLIGVGDKKSVAPPAVSCPETLPPTRDGRKSMLAIGCSTGGPNALLTILSALPATLLAAVVVIQHMEQKFTPGLVKWLDKQINLPVRIIEEGDAPEAGKILVASTNDHIVLTGREKFHYTPEPADNYYHPSVDVFFCSVAEYWPGSGLGILLTGMGRDGAKGLLTLRQRGWHTIAQDQATSVVFGMPKAAIDIGAAHEVLSVDAIAPQIVNRMMDRKGYGFEQSQR